MDSQISMEPTPVGAGDFEWRTSAAGRVLVCTALLPVAEHAFTTRALSFRGPDEADDYRRLGRVFMPPAREIVHVRQVHGRAVLSISPGDRLDPDLEADVLVSNDGARPLAIRVADCVPILIADRGGRVGAAVHAGWRGTAAEVAATAVTACAARGAAPQDLIAAIGPSIGPCCYQVDARVREEFLRLPSDASCWFTEDGLGRWKLDLWRANVEQLVAAGVPRDAVHVARLCTADSPTLCYSYRRDGAGAGRMAAAIRPRARQI